MFYKQSHIITYLSSLLITGLRAGNVVDELIISAGHLLIPHLHFGKLLSQVQTSFTTYTLNKVRGIQRSLRTSDTGATSHMSLLRCDTQLVHLLCCKCKTHTGFQRLTINKKNTKYLINFNTDYILKYLRYTGLN